MNKHTPGPWKIGWWKHSFESHHGASIRLGNGFIIAGVFSGKRDWLQKDRKAEANARLIAAAPDLYEALKRIAKAFEDDSRDVLIMYQIAMLAIQQVEKG